MKQFNQLGGKNFIHMPIQYFLNKINKCVKKICIQIVTFLQSIILSINFCGVWIKEELANDDFRKKN